MRELTVKLLGMVVGVFLIVVLGLGILYVFTGSDQADQAERPPVSEVAAEEPVAPEEQALVMTDEEGLYFVMAGEMMESAYITFEQIEEMHEGLLRDYDNPAGTTVNMEHMSKELYKFEAFLERWNDRGLVPTKMKALDWGITKWVDEVLIYVEKLKSALHVRKIDALLAKDQLEQINKAAEMANGELTRLKGGESVD